MKDEENPAFIAELQIMAQRAFPDKKNVKVTACPGMILVHFEWPDGDPQFELMAFEFAECAGAAWAALDALQPVRKTDEE